MDAIDEILASGPPGWRVSQIIRQWPIEIEMISCLVEKEEDGQTKTALRILLRCQGKPVKLVLRQEAHEDWLLHEETLMAGYILQHIVRASMLGAEQVLQEAVRHQAFGGDAWKDEWITKAVKEARDEIRYRLGRTRGGRRSAKEIQPVVIEVYYQRFLPFIQKAKKAIKKAQSDWQTIVGEIWKRSRYPDLPSTVIEDIRAMSASDCALELAARWATSGKFDRPSGFDVQVLKNARTKYLRNCNLLKQAIQEELKKRKW